MKLTFVLFSNAILFNVIEKPWAELCCMWYCLHPDIQQLWLEENCFYVWSNSTSFSHSESHSEPASANTGVSASLFECVHTQKYLTKYLFSFECICAPFLIHHSISEQKASWTFYNDVLQRFAVKHLCPVEVECRLRWFFDIILVGIFLTSSSEFKCTFLYYFYLMPFVSLSNLYCTNMLSIF